jgi:hypothetical protein
MGIVKYSLYIFTFVLGLGLGYKLFYSKQPTAETTENSKTVDVVTVIKEVVRNDGTVEKITTVTDKSKVTETKVVPKLKPYKASALVGYSFTNKQPVYGVSVEKTLSDSFSAGAWANTDKSAGLSLTISF